MKKLAVILAVFLMLCGSIVPAAASQASQVENLVTVAPDGSAQMNMTISLQLSAPADSLTFPVPAQAENILLNGAVAKSHSDGGIRQVQLPQLSAGSFTFTLSYRLPLVVQEKEDAEGLFLEIPLLSGFSYPIEAMAFTVTLPEKAEQRPGFLSGYHQESIESFLKVTVADNTISGFVTQSLKDHETLQLSLPVTREMFPQLSLTQPLLNGWQAAVLVFFVVAVVYYLACLLPVAPRKVRCFTAPEGISAGEVGTCLTGCGADLTMMVFSWAQLGYIRMEISGKRVSLLKQMDMGNERSSFEVRVFSALFRGRNVVAGTSYHYARTYRNVAASSPMLRQLFKPTSGNPRIFRILAGVAGALSGVCLAVQTGGSSGLQTLLGILFGGLCGLFSYFIQAGGRCIPLRDKSPLLVGFGCSVVWLALGVLTGQLGQTLAMVVFQYISGIAAAYGGQRTERGKRCLAELRSLRRFMIATPAGDLQRMLQGNPNYFYELAPYALAMGVDKKFARKFGREPLVESGFIFTDSHRELNASQTAQLMRQAADTLNALQKRLPYERLRGKS